MPTIEDLPTNEKIAVYILRLISLMLFGFGVLHFYLGIVGVIKSHYAIWQYVLISIQLLVEIIVFVVTGNMFYGLSDAIIYDHYQADTKPPAEYPDMDVIVPIRNVNLETLETTIKALRDQDYPQDRLHIYLADDTPDAELSAKYRELSEKYNLIYFYRPENKKYKAGMLNLVLPETKSEFVSFFDYDQVPYPGILKHFIDVLEAYPDRPFVQAKKAFRDLYNLSRVWSAMLYVLLFEVLDKMKVKLGTIMFSGSTACFRKKYIELVGGVPEDTFTEDAGLSSVMLAAGYHGVFTNVRGSLGTVPYGFPAQVAQLWRWSLGGAQGVRVHGPLIMKSKKLTLHQKIDFLSTIAITPTLVFIYTYVATFIILILTGVDSPRWVFFNISSLAYIALAPMLTYLVMGIVAMWMVQKHGESEFRYRQLIGFIIIALASNILIMGSGIEGLLGIHGPNSPKGKWTRQVPIFKISVVSFIIGLVLEYYSVIWLLQGFHSAIIIFLIGLSLFPALPISMYYSHEDTY